SDEFKHDHNQCGDHPCSIGVLLFRFIDRHNGSFNAFFSAAVAAFTFMLFLAGRWQWHVTSNQLKLAREEFISTHRPRIAMRGLTWIERDAAENIYAVMFRFQNEGESRAHIFEVGSKLIWNAIRAQDSDDFRLSSGMTFVETFVSEVLESGAIGEATTQ